MCSLSYTIEYDNYVDNQMILILAHRLHYDKRKQVPKINKRFIDMGATFGC